MKQEKLKEYIGKQVEITFATRWTATGELKQFNDQIYEIIQNGIRIPFNSKAVSKVTEL